MVPIPMAPPARPTSCRRPPPGLRIPRTDRTNSGRPTSRTNDRFRDECLNAHWFTTLAHAQTFIEAWRQEYNEDRPKKRLGGLTPAHYATQLAAERRNIPLDSRLIRS